MKLGFVAYMLAAAISVFTMIVLVTHLRTKPKYSRLLISGRSSDGVIEVSLFVGLIWPIAAPVALAALLAMLFTARNG